MKGLKMLNKYIYNKMSYIPSNGADGNSIHFNSIQSYIFL